MVAPTKRVPNNNNRNNRSNSSNNSGSNNNKDGRTKQIIIAQAYVKGYLVRKAYGRLSKKKLHRDKVALELYNTETAYVKNLEVMTEVYINPLREDPKKYGITKEEYHIIFANAETIVNLHKEILKVLEERIKNWSNIQKIGDIFLKYAPFLKMLNSYCSAYDAANSFLTQARHERKLFAAFIEKCEALDGVQMLPSYLIQPIQRVPRYNLLLEELIRSTWEWHNDYENLCNALRAMKQIADHLNESMHKFEKTNKVVKIQSDLGGECFLVEPHRRWIKDGPVARVRRQGRTSTPTSTSKLWIYLFNDVLIFAGRILLSYRFIERYPLASTSIQDVSTEKHNHLFQIACLDTQSTYILAAESEEIKQEWINAIHTAIQECAGLIPNKVENRKTTDRDSTIVPIAPAPPQTRPSQPHHSQVPSHSSHRSQTSPHASTTISPHVTATPAQALQLQQQLSQRLQQRGQAQPLPSPPQTRSAHTSQTPSPHTSTILPPTSFVPPPNQNSQATVQKRVTPQKNIVPRITTAMNLDLSTMPITTDGDDWDEDATLTFAERRLMFERGLITQSQVNETRRPTRPVGKLSSNPNANQINKEIMKTLRPAKNKQETGKPKTNPPEQQRKSEPMPTTAVPAKPSKSAAPPTTAPASTSPTSTSPTADATIISTPLTESSPPKRPISLLSPDHYLGGDGSINSDASSHPLSPQLMEDAKRRDSKGNTSSATGNRRSAAEADIPQGRAGEMKKKYGIGSVDTAPTPHTGGDLNAPLLGDGKAPKAKEESGCCVIL